jgi:hypothetical protein
MARAPFTLHPHYTQVAIAYRNTSLIADSILPYIPVGSEEFRYNKYTREDRYTIPNTLVGRKGRPNQVDFSSIETTDFTQDYGLEDPVPNKDIENAKNNPELDPLGNANEGLMDLILLDREVRTANLCLNPANYAAANQVALLSAGTGAAASFDVSGSKPIDVIMNLLDVPLMRPNFMAAGQLAWSALRRNEQINKASNRTSGDSGVVGKEFINELFELEDTFVGQGFVNTAKKGQPAALARVWSDSILLFYRDSNATNQRGTTYGFTARFGTRVAGTIEDPDIGLYGGQRVRAGESVREVLSAPDLACLITNAKA